MSELWRYFADIHQNIVKWKHEEFLIGSNERSTGENISVMNGKNEFFLIIQSTKWSSETLQISC